MSFHRSIFKLCYTVREWEREKFIVGFFRRKVAESGNCANCTWQTLPLGKKWTIGELEYSLDNQVPSYLTWIN